MHLMIVRRGRVNTFQMLQREFADERPVTVIWDRRRADRRGTDGAIPTDARTGGERRRGERRGVPPASWDAADFILVQVPDDARPA